MVVNALNLLFNGAVGPQNTISQKLKKENESRIRI